MRLEPPFRPAGEHIAVDLPGATALFTTRPSGDARADPTVVAQAAGLPRERLGLGRQVHGAAVRRIRAVLEPGAETEPADGQATALAGVAPVVLVADCLPIALAADGAVAMLHGGWRGLVAGIVEEGVRALHELGATGPIRAAIGPGAGVCCYEAGEEVHAAFAHLGPTVRCGAKADLRQVARLQLVAAGVDEVHDAGLCTICADPQLFFSHRREGEAAGRQAGVVWRS